MVLAYSKSEFDDLVLSPQEIEAIKELKTYSKMHQSKIACFVQLDRLGFLSLANPDSLFPDGRGGQTSDGIYMLSDKYREYLKYLHKKQFFEVLKLLGELKP